MEARTVDKFRQSFETVRRRLGDLKPLHKVLIGSGLVIFLMGMFIVAQYAGKSDQVLINVSAENHAAVLARFNNNGINVTPQGDNFLVPVDRRDEAYGIVTELESRSAGAPVLLGLIKDQPWYANRHQNKQQYYAALSQVLGDVMSHWSYIRKAEVFLTPPEEGPGGLGRQSSRPVASVAVTATEMSLTPDQVEGIALFLSGTVAGLEPGKVAVINARTGQPLRTRDDQDRANSAYMELQANVDNYWRQKIERNLSNIPAVIVQVNATVDASRETSSDLTYHKEGEGTVSPLTSETEKKNSATEAGAGGVAGVQPNTGTGISAPSNASPSNTETETTAAYSPKAGMRETRREDPKGYARKINATVKVPRSYYARIWQLRNKDSTTPPDDAAIKAIETEEVTKITAEVRALIDTEAANAIDGSQSLVGTVVVNTYTDLDPIAALAPQSSGAESGFMGMPVELVNLPWGSVGLTLLAAMSLFMMFRLVRSSAASRDLPSAEELVGIPPSLSSSLDDLIGEADESDPAIDAVELDDEELRARTIMEQIGELVGHDPGDATRVVNRWIGSAE